MSDPNVSHDRATPLTDSSLIEQVRAGSAEACEQIFHIFASTVRSWCQRSGLKEQDADDVVQDTFRSVFEKISDFHKDKPGDSFRKWLRTITHHKIIDHFRKEGPQPVESDVYKNLPAPGEDESDFVQEESERKQAVRKALDIVRLETSPLHWKAFWMTTIDGNSGEEAAETLGLTVNAVYKAKSRVIARFKKLFAGLDLFDDFFNFPLAS